MGHKKSLLRHQSLKQLIARTICNTSPFCLLTFLVYSIETHFQTHSPRTYIHVRSWPARIWGGLCRRRVKMAVIWLLYSYASALRNDRTFITENTLDFISGTATINDNLVGYRYFRKTDVESLVSAGNVPWENPADYFSPQLVGMCLHCLPVFAWWPIAYLAPPRPLCDLNLGSI